MKPTISAALKERKGNLKFSLDPEITCQQKPEIGKILLQSMCPDYEKQKDEMNVDATNKDADNITENSENDDYSYWYRQLKQDRYGQAPSASHFRSAKHRWTEKAVHQRCGGCNKKKFINPFSINKKKTLSGGNKRKIVENWGKMWDSALSDLQFGRIVFENNPDAEQTYKSDKERINDGCRKLWSIAKMNQNIITMMMKKFVSGPPNKLYTLNRIEAAQCWSRIVDNSGLVTDECCVDLPLVNTKRFNIPSLRKPKALAKDPGVMRKSNMYKLPEVLLSWANGIEGEENEKVCSYDNYQDVLLPTKRNPAYWLDPSTVPPVSKDFKEDEFYVEPKDDPTGEVRRELAKAKEIAKRYTRFAHIIEKSAYVMPNMERVNQLMDENFVEKDVSIRKQTLLQNFFSSHRIEQSPDFKRDALYATILSRNDNPHGAAAKKQFPYNLAEDSKLKLKKQM